MLEQINSQVLIELHKNSLNLDHYWTLLNLDKQDIIPKVLFQILERKLLIVSTGKEYLITAGGQKLLEALQALQNSQEVLSIQIPQKELKEALNEKFEVWWSSKTCYPTSDGFSYKGKIFEPTRKLTVKKEECKVLFQKIVASGEYTPDQIISATKTHIEKLKRDSFRTGKNSLSYLQSSLIYLRDKYFEPFLNQELKEIQENNTISI